MSEEKQASDPVGPGPEIPVGWGRSIDGYIKYLENEVTQQKEELRELKNRNGRLEELVRKLSKDVIPERFLSLKDVMADSDVHIAPMFDAYRCRFIWPMPTEAARTVWTVDIPRMCTKEHVENVFRSWHEVYRGDMLRNIGLGLDALVELTLGELVGKLKK